MSTILALDERVYERLCVLSNRMGQSPETILDQALVDYERKLESKDQPPMAPRTSSEAELLDDPGRIRIASRDQREVQAHVVSVGRLPCRVSSEVD
jgi:hypothetical protein